MSEDRVASGGNRPGPRGLGGMPGLSEKGSWSHRRDEASTWFPDNSPVYFSPARFKGSQYRELINPWALPAPGSTGGLIAESFRASE